jgi:hypothetical protein
MIVRRGMRKLFIGLPLLLIAVALFGFIVMNLWNWLVPAVFGGKLVTFWQALGILALARILVGGFFRRGRFVHNWNQLTPEEREKFRAAMHQRRCGDRPHEEHGTA